MLAELETFVLIELVTELVGKIFLLAKIESCFVLTQLVGKLYAGKS